jgi:hypothetical protein
MLTCQFCHKEITQEELDNFGCCIKCEEMKMEDNEFYNGE